MKRIKKSLLAALATVGFALVATSGRGQSSVISSLGQNGRMVFENLQPGSTASVDWASSVQGPWTKNWAGLDSLTVDSNGTIHVNVPMFYRVSGMQSSLSAEFHSENRWPTFPINQALSQTWLPANSFPSFQLAVSLPHIRSDPNGA